MPPLRSYEAEAYRERMIVLARVAEGALNDLFRENARLREEAGLPPR